MTDAQALALQDYGQYSEPWHRKFARTSSAVQEPKLRGWRIDPAEQFALLKKRIDLRIERRSPSVVYWGIPEYWFEDKSTKQSKAQREKQAALRKEFLKHAEKWSSETKFLSSVHQITLHPSYLRIIGMGPVALPFIFEELKKKPGHWFSALYAITGADPVPKEDEGVVRKMAQHWLTWGKEKGVY